MDSTRPSSEIRSLTALRAVAAGLVLCFHYVHHRYGQPDLVTDWIGVVGHRGYLAVDIFFVLSGFVLTLRYAGEVGTGHFRWGSYFIRRVARIWPMYFVVLAIWAAIGSNVNLSNLTFTQSYFSDLVWTGNNVAWSLSIEESFYLVLPFMLMTVVQKRTIPRLIYWSVASIVAGIVLVGVSQLTGLSGFYGFMSDTRFMVDRTLFGYMPEFALGVLCGLNYTRRGAPASAQALCLITIGVIGIYGTLLASEVQSGVDVQPFGWIIAVFSAILISGLCNRETVVARLLSQPLPVYMGRISFALYLLHTSPLFVLFRPLPLPLFFIAANMVSAMFYELIEKRGHRLILYLHRQHTTAQEKARQP
jgi:peptidoglycan/LPS O-acetylase OafA/YrhL